MDPQQEIVISTFESLARTASRKEKERLLTEAFRHPYSEIVKHALSLATDPYITFGVIAQEVEMGQATLPSWEVFVEKIESLADRKITGNEARKTVEDLTQTTNPAWNKWAARIINKELLVGAAAKTINKVAGVELIREFKVSLCDGYNPEEEGAENTRSLFGDNYILEPKLDGYRACAFVDKGKVIFYGRSGKLLANTHFVEQDLLKLNCDSVVFDGELMADTFQNTASICGSDVAALSEEMIKKLKFHVFDIIPSAYFFSQGREGSCTNLMERKEQLKGTFAKAGKLEQVVLLPWEKFNSMNLEQYGNHLEQGFEGSILKQVDLLYMFSRTSSHWYKIKPVAEIDCEVVGFQEGEGELTGSLGALLVEGKASIPGGALVPVKVRVGTGFNDQLRKEIWGNRVSWQGKQVEIRYQNVTQDSKTGEYSLRFPRFGRKRDDK